MLPSWCSDTISVLRAPWVASRGSKVRDWANAVPHAVTGCSFQYQSSVTGDPPGRALSVQTAATCYCPPDADVQAGDRVVFGGETFEVEGAPLQVRSPFGGCSHVLLSLTARRG